MKFGEWQASRGIQPWVTKPKHLMPAFETFVRVMNELGKSAKKTHMAFADFSEVLSKEDI